MATVLLFHHALGLTPGVQELASAWRDAGHQVHTPDLYDGATFDDVEAGVAHAQELGFDTVVARAETAFGELGEVRGLVVAGISLGVVPAQTLAQTRRGVAGAVLVSGCLPLDHVAPSWPGEVPVQVHLMERDPFVVDDGDLESAEQLSDAVAAAELYRYDGEAHLFVDASHSDHDPAATDQVTTRVCELLDRMG